MAPEGPEPDAGERAAPAGGSALSGLGPPTAAGRRGRVLTLAHHLGSVGGTESAQLAIFEGLARRGWAVHLVYVSAGDYFGRWRALAETLTRVRATLPARGAPVASTLGTLHTALAGLRPRPEVVYVHNAGDVPVALAVAAATRAPLVTHLHLPPPTRQPGWLNALLGRSAAVLAPSQDTAGRWVDVAHLDRARLSVVPLGIDVERFSPLDDDERRRVRAGIGVGAGEPMILYAGRLERIKGAHFLLEAQGRLAQPAHVVFCGAARDPAYLGELHAAAAGRPVSFLGRRADVAELMAAADLVVAPSNWLETQGLVISEAMACGTPVVASDVGGFGATMRGFPDQLVPPADPAALAEALGRYLPWRRTDPGLGGRSRAWVVEHLSAEHSLEAIDGVLTAARRR